MSNSLETTREIIQDSAANLDKFYTPDAGDKLRLVLATIDEAVAGQEATDALIRAHRDRAEEVVETAIASRDGLRQIASIIEAAKVDDFKASKSGRDEAVKVLHQLKELVENALHGDDDNDE